ncbi:ABC transporter substrate-binding protein [Marinobacter sp. UBA2688]|uniref:ABC transporter substrate-binding protein n=1 Tax=Marinobacter sp. UBA2688 TaxID=1946816 RepID=UPI00257F019F|nr:ABC transporter substrate-binding protein [Marinobacter sp. UBA2688]
MSQQPITTPDPESFAAPTRPFLWAVLTLLFVFLLAGFAHASDRDSTPLPVVSVSVLQFGTAHWELDHIQHRELDQKNGYRLELKLVANLPASRLAVTSGSVNGAVADLLWAQSRFQSGTPYLYVPFSSRIGDIVVPENSDIRSVADLAGKRIGVAGGPDSKGWILLQKVAEQQGVSLTESADVQFAAPPLLSQALKRDQVDVIVTYWHFAARQMGEGGWRSAFGMADLLTAMNLDPNLPVLGYVFPAEWAEDHRSLVDRFAASLREAKAELAQDESHWQRLRPLMGKPQDGVIQALKEGFIAGTPAPLTDQRIADLHRLLTLTGADSDNLMSAELFYRSRP